MKAILTAAWTAVLFIASIPASAAAPQWDRRQVTVDYSDLDLANAHGVATLNSRVHGAIRQVCAGPDFTLQDKMQQQACAKSAGAAAAADIETAVGAAGQRSGTIAKGNGSAIGSSFGSATTGSRQSNEPLASIRQTPGMAHGSGAASFGKSVTDSTKQPWNRTDTLPRR